LLIPADEIGLKLIAIRQPLEVVTIVIFIHGAAIRFWNHALYSAAIAAGALLSPPICRTRKITAPRETGCYGRWWT
jgi:hypothetical protein